MIKKSYYILIVFIILILTLLFSVVFANVASNDITDFSAISNSRNAMMVALVIDYGQITTQNNYVTLNLDVTTGQEVNLNDLKVQFSLDNKNWSGYNPLTCEWENNFLSEYQTSYPDFYIGLDGGLKTIYVKVIDKNGNTRLASAKINFSPKNQDPYIINPQSLELNNFQNTLDKAGIKSGSGSLYDPYIISDNNIRLVSKMPNVTEICYCIDNSTWSSWHKITNEQANIPIIFDKTEGLKKVRLKCKNKYGLEGSTEIIYYLLDYSKPIINLHTNYHSFIAIGGVLQFDLETNDNLSNVLNFEIEIYDGKNNIIKKGRVKKYDDNKSVIIPVIIEGLPKGRFNVNVTVIDEARNKNMKQIFVNSL